MMGGTPGGFRYQPALDGLRAVAVGAVLLYHADVPWMPGGYLGVDLFFVLSGFLITSLLLDERVTTGRISVRSFWLRRARRLLPALGLVLLAVAAYAVWIARPGEVAGLRDDMLASLGYVTNWHEIVGGGSYFEQFGAPSPLRHAWSLAIEEQFYLVWPLLLPLLIFVTRRRAALFALLGVGALASATTMAVLYEPGSDPSRVYYGTDTRAQALLVGAALAVLLARGVTLGRGRRALVALAVPAAAVIGAAFVVADASEPWMYSGGFLVVALAAAVVIAAAVQPGVHPLGRLLAWRPLRAIGTISYGLYLWHWPVYVALTPERVGADGDALLGVRLSVTLAIATASYVLLEGPIRRLHWSPSQASGSSGDGRQSRRRRLARQIVFPVGAAAVVLAATLGATAGTPSTIEIAAPSERPVGPTARVLGTSAVSSNVAPTPPTPPKVMLVGDSVATTLGSGFERAAPETGETFWSRTIMGCGLADHGVALRNHRRVEVYSACEGWVEHWRSSAQWFDPDVTLVLFDVWVVSDTETDGRMLAAGSPESDAFLVERLDAGVDALRDAGGRVVLLTAPYNNYASHLPGSWPEDDRARIDHYNALLREYVRTHAADASLIDLNALLAEGGSYSDSLGGVPVRLDGVHFNDGAGTVIWPWLRAQLSLDRTPHPR